MLRPICLRFQSTKPTTGAYSPAPDKLCRKQQKEPKGILGANAYVVSCEEPDLRDILHVSNLGKSRLARHRSSRRFKVFAAQSGTKPFDEVFSKRLIYDQFCAGENKQEISRTRQAIKQMGFAGIILCYGQETQITKGGGLLSTSQGIDEAEELKQWSEGTLKTIDLVGEGDWVGIKISGGGPKMTEALLTNSEPPPAFLIAMHKICERAKDNKCRLWIDAEQQARQPAIDRWTIDLMRRYNIDGQALVYNTLQAYLKESRTKLKHQLSLAHREGWMLAIKLVRGAYIANDQRDKIHDTKLDTDNSYNGIVRDILHGANLGFTKEEFPQVQLFLASHNPHNIDAARKLVIELTAQGKLKVLPDFGQLQGMMDRLGCELLDQCDEMRKAQFSRGVSDGATVVPKVYKCLTWGSVQTCLQYLLRRTIENISGSDRLRDAMPVYATEIRRRMLRAISPFR